MVDRIDLRNRALIFYKMPAEIDECLIFADIIPVCGDIRAFIGNDAKIYADAAGLRDFPNAHDLFLTKLLKKRFDLFDDVLHYQGKILENRLPGQDTTRSPLIPINDKPISW